MMRFVMLATVFLALFSLAGGITFLVCAWRLHKRQPAPPSRAGEVLKERAKEAFRTTGDEASRRAALRKYDDALWDVRHPE